MAYDSYESSQRISKAGSFGRRQRGARLYRYRDVEEQAPGCHRRSVDNRTSQEPDKTISDQDATCIVSFPKKFPRYQCFHLKEFTEISTLLTDRTNLDGASE